MKQYIIVSGSSPEYLAELVNNKISVGYVPTGGILWLANGRWYQAMVLSSLLAGSNK